MKLCSRRLPTPAEGFVKLHDGEALVELRLGEGILGGEKLLLRFEHFVISGFAGDVALSGDGDGFLIGDDSTRLLEADFCERVMADESISDLLESSQSGLLVLELCSFPCSGRLAILAVETASLKDRSGQVGGNRPDIRAAGGNGGELGAGPTVEGGQANFGEEIPEGDADLSIGRADELFGLANIGPAFQQSRRQAGGNLKRKRLLEQAGVARNGTRILAEENIDLVFFEGNASLEIGHGGSGDGEGRFGASGFEFGGDTALETLAEDV